MGGDAAADGPAVVSLDDSVTAEELGHCLLLRRLAAGISQRKLATLVNMPRYRLDHWESGHGLAESVKLFACFEACGSPFKLSPLRVVREADRA